MTTTFKRHPNVPLSGLALTEERAEEQIKRGLFLMERGEPIPIPVDRLGEPGVYLHRELWRRDRQGRIHRPGVRMTAPTWPLVPKLWRQMHPSVRRLRDMLAYGHDVHVTAHANLFARHFHARWANPFEPDRFDEPLDPLFEHDCNKAVCDLKIAKATGRLPMYGFVEDCGWVSGAKLGETWVQAVTGALADAAGTGDAAEFNDFNEHEVGTSATADTATNTALIATSGIALVAGTQVDTGDQGGASRYTSVATITADATETWQEHGIFSTTVDTLMDRNLTGGQSVNSSDQVQYTYTADINEEA